MKSAGDDLDNLVVNIVENDRKIKQMLGWPPETYISEMPDFSQDMDIDRIMDYLLSPNRQHRSKNDQKEVFRYAQSP